MKRIKDLIVYQKSKELVIFLYKMLEDFPETERFALCGQMRRAVVSIPSNIAEGMGRLSDKDQSHFQILPMVHLWNYMRKRILRMT